MKVKVGTSFYRFLMFMILALTPGFALAQTKSFACITLSNGDLVGGEILEETDSAIVISTGTQTVTVMLTQAREVQFSGRSLPCGNAVVPDRTDVKPPPPEKIYGPHLVGLNLPDLIYRNFSVHYEMITAKGFLGLKIPFKYGFMAPEPRNGLYRNRAYSLGLDLNVYPAGPQTTSVFFGFGYEGGQYRFVIPPSGAVKASEAEPIRILYHMGGTHFGVLLNPGPNFSIIFRSALGLRFENESYFMNYNVHRQNSYLQGSIDISLCTRF